MSGETRVITIEVRDDDAATIEALIDACASDDQPTSHGRLLIETLAAMLIEDVALAVRRPGSWGVPA